jgi:tetratricopeptide (TPR) repeat protein
MASMSFAGTPAYMAPEIWGGAGGPASDQYSLAVTYAELRQGKVPIPPRRTMHDLMLAHLDGLFEFDQVIGEAERAVLRKAMAKLPEERYPSCSTFVEELARAVGWSFARKPGKVTMPPPWPNPAPPPPSTDVPTGKSIALESTPPPSQRQTLQAVAGTPGGTGAEGGFGTTGSTPPPLRKKVGAPLRPKPAPKRPMALVAGLATLGLVAVLGGLIYVLFIAPSPPSPRETDSGPSGPALTAGGPAGPTPTLPGSGSGSNGGESGPVSVTPRVTEEDVGAVVQVAWDTARLAQDTRPTPEIKPRPSEFWNALVTAEGLIRNGQLDDGLKLLGEFVAANAGLAPTVGVAFNAVQNDVQLLWTRGRAKALPVSLAGVQQVCLSAAKPPDPDPRLKSFYLALVPELLKRFVTDPDLGANDWTKSEPWVELGKSLAALETVAGLDRTWLARLRVECALMVRHLGPAGAPRVTLTAPPGPKEDAVSQAYVEYLDAARACSDLQPNAAARQVPGRLVAAVRAEKAKSFLNPARSRLAGRLLVSAERDLLPRGPELDLDKPFADPKDAELARAWLKPAIELLANDVVQAERARARLVVAAAFPEPDPQQVRDVVTKDTAAKLAAALPPGRDQAQFWLAYARTRAAGEVGEAVQGYEQVVKYVAENVRPRDADLEFAKRLARQEFIDRFAKVVGNPSVPEKDRTQAAKVFAQLARAIFVRRPLMTPTDPNPDEPVVVAADLAGAAAALSADPTLTALARVFDLEAGRNGSLEAKLTEATNLVKRAPGQPAALAYLGLVEFFKYGVEPDWEKKIALLTSARQHLREAAAASGNPDDTTALRTLLYRDLAMTNMHLGNVVPAEVRPRLEEAAEFANELLKLAEDDPRALDLLGCVREDQAWLGKTYTTEERKEYYRQAVNLFTRAIEGKGQNQLVRFHPMMHLGRCRYKWANTFSEDREPEGLLDKAARSLTHVRDNGRSEDKVEALYWLAMIEFTRAGLNWKKDATASTPRDLFDPTSPLSSRPRLTAGPLKQAKDYLTEVETVRDAAGSWYRVECAAWRACLACYEASGANTPDNPARFTARTDALDAIGKYAKLEALAAAHLRSGFLYSLLDTAMGWEKSKKPEKEELWKAFDQGRPVPGLAAKTAEEGRTLLQLYAIHYKARWIQIVLKIPGGDDPEKALRDIVELGKQTRLAAADLAGIFEGTAWELTGAAYKSPGDEFEIAVLTAYAFLAAQEFDPQLAFLKAPWNPVLAAQCRVWVCQTLVPALEKAAKEAKEARPAWYKKILAMTDKLLSQADTLLARLPKQDDKDVLANTKVVKELRGRLEKLPKQ